MWEGDWIGAAEDFATDTDMKNRVAYEDEKRLHDEGNAAEDKEPKEFEDYVKLVRKMRSSLGSYDLCPSRRDLEERKEWFRHIVANCDIPVGTKLTAEMLEGKRPENGISPEYLDFFIGRVTKLDLKENDPLSWDHI